jgi:hypothetical protein
MNFILKKMCRRKLREPLGKIIKEIELKKKIKNKEIITVGDRATQSILELKLKPKLAIVDYKIERKKIKYNYKFLKKVRIVNKKGTISLKAIDKIRNCLKYKNCLLEIIGEEDLLVLPVILEAKEGTIVFYGQPKRGIVLVNVTKKKKEEVKKIIKEYFKFYNIL